MCSLTRWTGDPSNEIGQWDQDLEKHVVELSTRMCQSMEYLLQDDMDLYGPASTVFTLRTAYEALKLYRPRTEEHIKWCREIMEGLRMEGLAFAACYFDTT